MNVMHALEFQMTNYGRIFYITEPNSASIRELYFPRWNHGIKQVLRTADHGLGLKHGLNYETRTKHYGLGIKYGLGYEQVHTGCKLSPSLSFSVM